MPDFAPLPIPDVLVFGTDEGVDHEVGDALIGTRRAALFLADLAQALAGDAGHKPRLMAAMRETLPEG